MVFGCGLGPLDTKKYLKSVKNILKLADEIKLRDKNSVSWAKKLIPNKTIEHISDPAYKYVKSTAQRLNHLKAKPILACFLRQWSKDYKGDLSTEAFFEVKDKFEMKLAAEIKSICKSKSIKPIFYSMHNFVIGGDDREFYRYFTKKYFEGEEFTIIYKLATVETTIKAMKEAAFCLTMRFHSVLFAHTLEVPFFAIDYTNGGKIENFLNDNNAISKMRRISDFVNSDNMILV